MLNYLNFKIVHRESVLSLFNPVV